MPKYNHAKISDLNQMMAQYFVAGESVSCQRLESNVENSIIQYAIQNGFIIIDNPHKIDARYYITAKGKHYFQL